MRTMVKEYEVYTFAELTEEAKEEVKRWYLEDPCLADDFTNWCGEFLHDRFPNSEIDVQYSLAYCQGDGLNIYGNIYLDEVLDHVSGEFTAKELKFFKWLFNAFGSNYSLPMNNHYCYCICDRCDYMEDYIDNMEWDNYKNIPYKTMEKFNQVVRDYLSDLCSQMEDSGYKWFYEISDDDLEEFCEANNYEFFFDGSIAW